MQRVAREPTFACFHFVKADNSLRGTIPAEEGEFITRAFVPTQTTLTGTRHQLTTNWLMLHWGGAFSQCLIINTDLQSNTYSQILSSILWKVVSNCTDYLVRVKPRNTTGLFSCRGKRLSAHFLSQTVTHAGTFLFSSSNNWHLRDLNQKHYRLSTSAYNILWKTHIYTYRVLFLMSTVLLTSSYTDS